MSSTGYSLARAVQVAAMTALTAAALVVGSGGVATAEHVDPVQRDGNPKCADLNPDWNELKVDKAPNGTYSDSDSGESPGGPGPLEFTVENSDGEVFDWKANMGVDAVIVKGGNQGANVYTYDPEATADTRLRSPDNTSGNVPQVSHISACYDVEGGGGGGQQDDDNEGDQQAEEDQRGEEDQRDDDDPRDQQDDGDPGSGDGPGDRDADDDDRSGNREGTRDEGGSAPRQKDEPRSEEGEGEVRGDRESSPRQPAGGGNGDAEGGVRGISRSGGGDGVAEETAPGSDDASGEEGADLPFTGLPLVGLFLIGIGLILTGAAARVATRD